MKFNVCAMHTVHCLSWLSVQYNNKKLHFGFLFNQWRLHDFFVGGAGGGGGGGGGGLVLKTKKIIFLVLKNELNWEKVMNA